MRNIKLALLGSFASAALACGGTTATADTSTQTQTQAQSTAADGGTRADGQGPRGHHHPGPPPEAFEACESKVVGDACTVTFGSDSLAGKCVTSPDGGPDTRIVCRPDKLPEHDGKAGHGGHPHGPPPAEVFAACDGKAADEACSVTIGDRSIEGTCKAPPPGVAETRLGCAPARPPRHEGAPPRN